MPLIHDIGAIASLNIPEGWVAYAVEELLGERILQRISPYDNENVVFLSCVRGVELSTPGREAFMNTLYSNFHTLNQTEIVDLREVLEGMANPQAFTVEKAGTAYLNSRRVISVTGTWPKIKRKESACFIDLRGDSQNVQQVSFLAPGKEFERYAELVENEILLSIKWQRT